MKKIIIIGIVLLVGGFFTFFDVNFDKNNKLEFLESYKDEIGYSDYEVKQILSTNKNDEGLKLTFNGCAIDTSNMDQFGLISRKLAAQVNKELNAEDEFKNIILIFKPKNPEGIRVNEFMSIDELKFNHKTSELK